MKNLLEYATSHAPVVVLAASVAVLGSALTMEHVAEIAPCRLCIAQRWPYAIVIVLAAIALVPMVPDSWRRVLVALAAPAFAVGGAIAVYHTGVELGWFTAPAACSGTGVGAATIEELRSMLTVAPVVRCDVVPWTLFGISLAGYNIALSLLLSAFSARAAWRWKAPPG